MFFSLIFVLENSYFSQNVIHVNILFIFDFIYLFLDRGEGREKGRETSMCGCFSRAPYWGPGPQPRHAP